MDPTNCDHIVVRVIIQLLSIVKNAKKQRIILYIIVHLRIIALFVDFFRVKTKKQTPLLSKFHTKRLTG